MIVKYTLLFICIINESNILIVNNSERLIITIVITNSAAHGGGGSFKNRQPIGKVGCCESRMAERTH